MKEQDLHKRIRNNASDDNSTLYKALAANHPELAENTSAGQNVPDKKPFYKRVAIFAPLMAAVVVAIILIPTLLLITGNNNADDDYWGGDASGFGFNTWEINCTVEEYNQINGTNFLYFDWTDTSDYTVEKYTDSLTGEFLGLGVLLYYAETNEDIECVICADESTLDFLKYNIKICVNEDTVLDYSVKWRTINNKSYGIFEYGGYDYYVTLKNKADKARLFELIEVLITSQS